MCTMEAGKDVALENLDKGFHESKNIQLLQFLNDQAEISSRLKTCRFKEPVNTPGPFAPDSRIATAPEGATRTYRLRPLSARPSTASGRQFQEPLVERGRDDDNVSLNGGRRKSAVRRKASDDSSSSSPVQRPETVCGFYDLADVEEESEDDAYDVESDLDVLSIESITSTGPRDDIDDDEVDEVTYEFDVPESDRSHVEAEVREKAGGDLRSWSPVVAMNSPRSDNNFSCGMSSPPKAVSPTRIKSSRQRASMPSLGGACKPLARSFPVEPQPPPSRLGFQAEAPSGENSTTKVLRHMRTRSSSTELRERGRSHSLSKGLVWGEQNLNNNVISTAALAPHQFRPPSDRNPLPATPLSPRISFEEIPIEKQGVTLRTVARIDCDASFYRKLRHRSAPAMRTEELARSRSEGNSPVRAKPIGIYHLPPLSKEKTTPTSTSAHAGVRSLASPSQFLPQHNIVFQEPEALGLH